MDCLQIRAPPSAIAVTEECAVVQENVFGGCGLDSGGSRQGPVSGCFEDYNAILDFIIGDSQGLTTVFWDDVRIVQYILSMASIYQTSRRPSSVLNEGQKYPRAHHRYYVAFDYRFPGKQNDRVYAIVGCVHRVEHDEVCFRVDVEIEFYTRPHVTDP